MQNNSALQLKMVSLFKTKLQGSEKRSQNNCQVLLRRRGLAGTFARNLQIQNPKHPRSKSKQYIPEKKSLLGPLQETSKFNIQNTQSQNQSNILKKEFCNKTQTISTPALQIGQSIQQIRNTQSQKKEIFCKFLWMLGFCKFKI